MKRSEVINLVIAIILAAVGIFVGKSHTGAYILIIIAVMFLIIIFGRHKYLLIPRIYFTRDAASNAALRIYETAAENGGQLITTHINPQKLSPKEDYAVNRLKSVKETLIYKRFIVIDDKQLENEWISNTLAELDPKIEVSVYFIDSFQETPSITRKVFPRANILLYNKEKKYMCLLGLDRLRTADPRYEVVNFALEFHTPKAFHTLYRYFESITAFRYVKRVKSFEEHKAISYKDVHKREIQSILNSLIVFGGKFLDVLHIGIFGKMARYLNGLEDIEDTEEHEADIDVMIFITPGKKEEIKNELRKVFKSPKTEIIWGDDLNYFYHFRSEGKITIDIEIQGKDTFFYEQHPLLGHSIFAQYKTIHKSKGQYLENLLRLPCGFSRYNRFKILRDDRKGLNEFKQKLELNSVEIDPRRVVSLCIKNTVWAMSGSRPLNINGAFDFLSNRWVDVFPSVTLQAIKEMLMKSKGDIRKRYGEYKNQALSATSDALCFSNSQLKE